MRRTIVMLMIGCAIPVVVIGCGGGESSSDGGGAVAQNDGAEMAGGDDYNMEGDDPGGGDDYGGGEGDYAGGEGDYAGGEDAGGEPNYDEPMADGGDPAEGDYAGGDPGYGSEGDPMGEDDAGFRGDPLAPGGEGANPPGYAGEDPGYAGEEPDYAGGDPGSEPDYAGEAPDYAGNPGDAVNRDDPLAGGGAPDYAGDDPNYEGEPGAEPPGYAGGDPGAGEEGVPGDFGPGRGRRAAPKGFDGAAQVAFQRGNEGEAFKYLYAHALSSAKGGADLLTSIQWVKGLKRPALAVRFGAGVSFKGPPNTTDFKPIGTTQQLPTRGQRGGGDDFGGGGDGFGDKGFGGPGGFEDEGGYPGGGGGGNASGGLIAKYAGDLGSGLMKEFESRVNRGAFGAALKNAPKPGRGRGGGYGGGDGGGGGYGGDDFAGGEDFGGGKGGAPGYADEPDAGGGYEDPANAGGDPGYGGEEGRGGGGRASGASTVRGITIVGVGPERELVSKAKKDGIDVLALFEVSVKVNPKTRLITNDTKMVLIDVAKSARIHTGKLMNNFKVQKARKDNKDDGIEKEIDTLFKFVDANLTVSPIPAVLTSEHIKKRVASLVASKPDNVLPVLTEIRFWHRRNLLDDEGLTAAYSQMLSPDIGAQLAMGSEDERKAIVKRWLPAEG